MIQTFPCENVRIILSLDKLLRFFVVTTEIHSMHREY